MPNGGGGWGGVDWGGVEWGWGGGGGVGGGQGGREGEESGVRVRGSDAVFTNDGITGGNNTWDYSERHRSPPLPRRGQKKSTSTETRFH